GDGQHEIARRVEDVLVEELRGYEDRLRGVEPADEAVQVEAGGEVEGVALEHAALHRSPARQVEEAGVEEGIEAALGVVLLPEAAGRGRARRARRIGARPPPLNARRGPPRTSLRSGTVGTMRRLGSGKPRPPGSHGEPCGMPGTVATRLPKAAKPSRKASWSGPSEPR